jgi:hydroxymethylbilane synthase
MLKPFKRGATSSGSKSSRWIGQEQFSSLSCLFVSFISCDLVVKRFALTQKADPLRNTKIINPMKTHLVIGSRGSKLALVQANLVRAELQRADPSLAIDIEVVKTSGDLSTAPLSVIGGKGVFTKELEVALLEGRIDLAVHSLKDLPTVVPEGLTIAAICKREDPRDALVLQSGKKAASLRDLPKSAVVGTSSPRRLAQLRHLRDDVEINDLRGNVDTRLRKLDEGQYDALILACAGLRRLNLAERISAALPVAEIMPAVGQGALAIQTRIADLDTIAAAGKLDHKFTRLACTAERAFLNALGGGCQLPIAGHAVVREKRIRLDGLISNPEGSRVIKDRIVGGLDEAELLGTRLAKKLLEQGAEELLRST